MENKTPIKKGRMYSSADEDELLRGDTVASAVKNAAMNFAARLNTHADGVLIRRSSLGNERSNAMDTLNNVQDTHTVSKSESAGHSSVSLERGTGNTANTEASTSAGTASATDVKAIAVNTTKQNNKAVTRQANESDRPDLCAITTPNVIFTVKQKGKLCEKSIASPKSDAKVKHKLKKQTKQLEKRVKAGESSATQIRLDQMKNVAQNVAINEIQPAATSTLHVTSPQLQNEAGKDAIAALQMRQSEPTNEMQVDSDTSKPKRKRNRAGKRVQAKKLRQAILDAQNALTSSDNSGMPEIVQKQTALQPSDTNKNTGNAVNRQLQQIKSSSTPKRALARGDTPPDVAHVTKRGKKNTAAHYSGTTPKPTMAEVVTDANLVLAIIDMPVPDVMVPLTKEKYDKLYQTINAFIMQSLDAPGNHAIPTFGENKHTKGVMKIRCSTPASKTWISSAIRYFPPLWKDMKLKAIIFNELPRSKKVLGLFQNCTLSNENVLKMLGAMNSCIDANRWSIISRSTTAKGTHIVMSINDDQLAALHSCDFKLHFGAGTAKFKDISKKIVRADASNEAASDMDVSENDEESDDNEVTIVSGQSQKITQDERVPQQEQDLLTEVDTKSSESPTHPSNSTAEGAKMDMEVIVAGNSSDIN